MAELRWVLLALGIVVIVAVYLWSQGVVQRWLAPMFAARSKNAERAVRVEPGIGATPSADADEFEDFETHDESGSDPSKPDEQAPAPEAVAEKIITLRLIPNEKTIACNKVVLALRAAGLKHGRYGIFHKNVSDQRNVPKFSVANLTEPGSFDLAKLSESRIPGMSFFMVLPGEDDPVGRFDEMVATARSLARELSGELRDDKGSSWSIQRERYVREEIIAYCHLHERRQLD
jgi:cell division protein ZipA